MGWFAVMVIIGLVMGGIWYFNEPLFHDITDTAKEGGATIWSWTKNQTKEKNITIEDIKDRIQYNTTIKDNRTYYGMPYSKVPCNEDSDCDWFERDLKCDTEKGECYR